MQESVCLSADDDAWVLINASPDIHSQIESFAPLHPRRRRDSPMQAIFLTNGDLDHCLGLLSLRENQPLVVYATEMVRRGFTEDNVLYRTLERFPGQVTWRTLKLGLEETVPRADGRPCGLTVKAVAVPGKPPLHLEAHWERDAEVMPFNAEELNVGLRFRQPSTQRTLAYLSAVGRLTPAVHEAMDGADCVLFDGTFWSSDELSAQRVMDKSAEDLAHWPVGGQEGSLSVLAELSASRRLFIHINNTNPMLREDSPERKTVEAAGWEVAYDGMEIRL